MNKNWKETLAALGAQINPDTGEIQHFGDPTAELLAARDATTLVPLSHLGLIELQGDEAQAFLHAQLTSDVNHLAPGAAQHSAWCTAKGRMLASFVVSHRPEQCFHLIVADELAAAMAKRLKMYVLRAKVAVRDLRDDFVLIGLSGPQAEAALTAAALPIPDSLMQTAENSDAQVLRLESNRFVIALPVLQAGTTWLALSNHARPAGESAWRWLDIQAGLPVITAATQEEFVPQMADFEKIGGVSFHKGCYPGQEIVARTQYLGKVKRHLYRLHSEHPLVAGAALFSPDYPDQAAGKIVTGAQAPEGGYAALAVVQANYSASLHLEAIDGPRVQASPVNT